MIKTPSNNQKCTIGCKLSDTADTADTLLFSGTPSGVFENMKIDTVKNTISFGPITVDSNHSNNSFSVQAKSGTHKILSNANYQITALSNIYSTNENNSKTNRLIITENKELKKFNSKSSAISSFSFNLKDEVWITMPTIVRTGGVVSFGNPIITVKKSSDKSVVKSGTTLDPSDKLDIEVTLPQSSISDASYSVDVSNLTYGWKLLQNKVETTGGPTDKCNIDLTVDKTSNDTHTVTGSGAFFGFSDLSTTTKVINEVSVGTGGKLTISSKHGTYKIMPKYSDCKIYSISSFGKTDDNNSNYYKIPPTDTINGTTKITIFEYFVKAATYSPFFYWAINGDIDWDLWDDNNPTDIYSGDIRTLLDKITNNISDEELSNMSMTKYNASEHSYSGGRKLDKGTFLVMVTKNNPYITSTPSGPNVIDDELHLIKTILRNGEVYKIYVFPDDKSAGSTWFDFAI